MIQKAEVSQQEIHCMKLQHVAMVIQADQHYRDLTADMLQLAGFSVVKAQEIQEARIEVQNLKQLDLVILHMELKDHCPPDFLEALHKQFPELFVVLTTAMDQVEIPPSLRKKVHMVVCKPFIIANLVDKLDLLPKKGTI